jgi:hypothetical protein
LKHTEISKQFEKYIDSFNQEKTNEFDLGTLEISTAIFKHVFKIQKSLWKQKIFMNRRKRTPIPDLFHDLVAI